jgi:hypothetical protein
VYQMCLHVITYEHISNTKYNIPFYCTAPSSPRACAMSIIGSDIVNEAVITLCQEKSEKSEGHNMYLV